ncbi:asparagine synthase (glutamine-hydrolyzing) [Flavicella sp.]|uniref:asparagine synthase (glutamine-hydrolyzing) n=1 Tax=Flavicella sp. TaxID=2957742 RepID=UPI0026166F9B|nr:asparagine synthase (glutamine-hydrolyzing) [Flavicella sp.]MDG1804978.1 asparagine synthase (glutamine-hydrolyzing) [Flavicella sp.]
MCGISGIIGKEALPKILKKMADVQTHRGPDHTGYWNDTLCFFGHNRLSIIDLTEDSNQPFHDVSERYCIVFNGEIYNYLELKRELSYNFKTHSDTEVLLASYLKWGKECLHKLNGMFAFAIWDKHEEKLFAARDRFGVKPFYYHLSQGTLYFASEIKGLHAAGISKVPNEKTWANFLCFGSYGTLDTTFWKDISQLPASHCLEYKNCELAIEKWYFFEKEVQKHKEKLTYQEVKTRYTDLLKDSLKLRFRSDVHVGFNISGGLDSSALLAFVNHQETKEKIQAYTFYTNDSRYDELPWVEEMISLTENPLSKVALNAKEVPQLTRDISFFQDEPFGGVPTLAYAKIFKEARENNVLVLLDGQGMDEQWAGYDYYLSNANQNIIQATTESPFKLNVFSDKLRGLAEKPEYPKPFDDDLLNKQYRDLFYTKIPRALRFNDRVSMASSTELREPFLDYRLVEFAFAQPLEYKIKDKIQKYVLRDIVSEFLSDNISYAPKRPLQTPQREWLGEDLTGFVSSEIQKIETSEYASWFDLEELKLEWEKYIKGNKESSFHIWQWISVSMLLNDKTSSI